MKKLLLNNGTGFNLDLGLLLIRVILGVLMAFYGYAKLTHFNEMAASDFWVRSRRNRHERRIAPRHLARRPDQLGR